MQTPSDLYRFTTDADRSGGGSGVLVVALGAFIDAGQVQRLLSEHLIGTGHASMVATFDVDQLFDYRGRRPTMRTRCPRWCCSASPTGTATRTTS